MTNHLLRFVVFVLGLPVLAQLSIPTVALALDQRTTQQRLTEIKKLSTLERNRLENNIEEFRALSEADRQHYRDLHSQIMKDRVQTGGAMLQLLQSYDLWLQTLSPAQQNELRKESDVTRKLILVQKFKADQEQQLKQESEQIQESREPTESRQVVRQKVESMSRSDLHGIMQAIINDLPADQKQADFEPPRLSQYFEIINTSLNAKGSPGTWPDEELLEKMKQAVTPRIAEAVKLHVVWDEKSERDTMVRLILVSINRQINESVRVSDDVRDRIYDSLSKAEQNEIKSMKTARAREAALTSRYYENKHDDSFKKAKEYRESLVELYERLQMPVPKMMQRLQKIRPSNKK